MARSWHGLVAHGDLGRSLVGGRPVTELVLERLPYTVALALAAVTLAAVLGGVGGTLAALRAGTLLDTTVMAGAALGVAVPTFWSGLLLILLFSLQLRWLPVTGADSPGHLILPAVTLALPTAAAVARLVRSGLLDVLGADYIRTAHAKGLTSRRVVARHVLRNGLVPVTAVLGLQLGHLLGGAFIVETHLRLAGPGPADGAGDLRPRRAGGARRGAGRGDDVSPGEPAGRPGARLARPARRPGGGLTWRCRPCRRSSARLRRAYPLAAKSFCRM